jgi:hypothetical protein
MHKIIFTQHATPVSDFCAETFIETTINQLL